MSPRCRHIYLVRLHFQNLLRLDPKLVTILTSCCYEFIKRYLTSANSDRTVDVAAKSVYVAARNLVFGLNLLHAPGFGLRSSELPKLWLVTANAINARAFNRKA
jgi:hypothetical protein